MTECSVILTDYIVFCHSFTGITGILYAKYHLFTLIKCNQRYKKTIISYFFCNFAF